MHECIPVIGSSPGYLGYSLYRSQEPPGRFVIEVRWARSRRTRKVFGNHLRLRSGKPVAALARVNAELDQATFGWSGSLEVGQRHYSRLQGRSFLLEYDNSCDSGYHIHSQWRDFAGDWGRDLL